MKAGVYDLPFDQFQRYHAVAQILARVAEGRRLRVLDVGGHPGLLRDFAPEHEVTIVDRLPAGRQSTIARGDRLPFPAASFDAAVSVDCLEHVATSARRAFVAEMARCSRGPVILAAPFDGEEVVAAELLLQEFLRATRGTTYPFLDEHEMHGLPSRAHVRDWLGSFGARTSELPNGYLPRWLSMMACSYFLAAASRYGSVGTALSRLYNRACAPYDAREPCYRYVLVADRERDPRDLISGLASEAPLETGLESGYLLALLTELCHHDLAAPEGQRKKLEGELLAVRSHVEKLEGYVRHVEEAIESERSASKEAREELLRREMALHDAASAYKRLESYARDLERRVKEIEPERDQARSRAEDLARELELARDQAEALRAHAESMAKLLEERKR